MKISVVIPSFNDSRIVETIGSILDQEYCKESIEFVVMDAGSDELLINKIRDILPDGGGLYLEKDDGIFDGINRGIDKASGDIILTIGSDDRVNDPMLFSKVENRFRSGENFIFCGLSYTNDQWKVLRYWPAYRFNYFNYLIGRQFAHFSLFCTKDIYEEAGGFNIKNTVNADYEFFHTVLKNRRKLKVKPGYIDEYCVQMRMGGNSSKSLYKIIGHNIRILNFLYKNDPLLLPGQILKPLHKISEMVRARIF